MPPDKPHRRRADDEPPGSGMFIKFCGQTIEVVKHEVTDPDKQVSLDEVFLIAQWIQAFLILGWSREAAEAAAMEKLRELRRAKQFFRK